MRPGVPGLLAVGALLAALLVVPTAAFAQRRAGGGGPGHRPPDHRPSMHRHVHHRIDHRDFHHRHFHHRQFHRPIFPVATYWSPFAYAPPSVFYDSPAFADPPPVYYDPPPVYSRAAPAYAPVMVAQAPPTPPPAQTPSVIEYPTGRYELRGDGMATAYTWVWVPNPPPAPPPDTFGPPAPASSVERAPSARRSELYRWTDEQGVEHWTDRRDRVPEKYRSRAKHPDPS